MIDLSVLEAKAAADPAMWGPVLEQHRQQATEGPALPSLGRMAGQLLKTAAAVVTHAATTGEVSAADDIQAARWATCRSCPQFRPADSRCGGETGCGCHLERKIPLAAALCPLGKW